jgi:glycolate oxidase FAD binding subunit
MVDQDIGARLHEQIKDAVAARSPLRIVGGDSKRFYGGPCHATTILYTADHSGIVDYEPTELVLTARAGTRIEALASVLRQHKQMLAFEPPSFAGQATLGGTLACGFSGPRRPFVGSVRDFTLGCTLINGAGERLHFGGKVIKNVAGFDVSRLMVGALGTLGVLLDISLKVLPLPEAELTLAFELSDVEALFRMNQLAGKPWPLSGLAYYNGLLRVRLTGAESAIAAAARQLGGQVDPTGEAFWTELREQQIDFFREPGDLWRISLASSTPLGNLPGSVLIDWCGSLRWLKTIQPASVIHSMVAEQGGHALRFRGACTSDWIRLDPPLLALQRRLRNAFDPHGLFNPGRLIPDS